MYLDIAYCVYVCVCVCVCMPVQLQYVYAHMYIQYVCMYVCNRSPKQQVFQPLLIAYQRVIGNHYVVNGD